MAEGVATRRNGSRRECVAAQRPWLSALRSRRLSSQALDTLAPEPMLRKHGGRGGGENTIASVEGGGGGGFPLFITIIRVSFRFYIGFSV